MKLKHSIEDKVFFYEDVFDDDSILQKSIDKSKKQESSGNFIARFGISRKDNLNFSSNDYFSFNKPYKSLNDSELFLFENSSYIKNEHLVIDRKDIDVQLSNEIQSILNNKITRIVKDLYDDIEIEPEYSTVIKYGSGYKMNKHRDGIANRICTAILYLNTKDDNSEGGDLIFFDNKNEEQEIYRYSPVKNELIIFDSCNTPDTLPHLVTEIKDWERYVYRIYFDKVNEK